MTTLFVLLLAIAIIFLVLVIVKKSDGGKPDSPKRRIKK